VQVAVLPVADAQFEAAEAFAGAAVARRLRAEVWPDGSLGARVREAARRRVPYVAVIGAREAGSDAVVLRDRAAVERAYPVPQALELLAAAGAPPL
jgi:threonyl-tRNA synthetase